MQGCSCGAERVTLTPTRSSRKVTFVGNQTRGVLLVLKGLGRRITDTPSSLFVWPAWTGVWHADGGSGYFILVPRAQTINY